MPQLGQSEEAKARTAGCRQDSDGWKKQAKDRMDRRSHGSDRRKKPRLRQMDDDNMDIWMTPRLGWMEAAKARQDVRSHGSDIWKKPQLGPMDDDATDRTCG